MAVKYEKTWRITNETVGFEWYICKVLAIYDASLNYKSVEPQQKARILIKKSVIWNYIKLFYFYNQNNLWKLVLHS